MKKLWIVGAIFAVWTVVLIAQATNIRSSGTLPTNCRVGDIYIKTGSGLGFYACTATNDWDGPMATTAGSGAPTCIVAASDESDTDNTVHNDAELSFAVDANSEYYFDLKPSFTTGTSTTPDAKFNFTYPASAVIDYSGIAFTLTATATTTTYIPSEFNKATPSTELAAGVLSTAVSQTSPVLMTGVLVTAGTSGTMQLQWAQNTTTGGTPTVRENGSVLCYAKSQ